MGGVAYRLCLWMDLVDVDLKKVPQPLGQFHLSCSSSSEFFLLFFCFLLTVPKPPSSPAARPAARKLSYSGLLGQVVRWRAIERVDVVRYTCHTQHSSGTTTRETRVR